MTENVTSCPLCGASEFRLFDQTEFHGHSVRNQICAACGLVFQSPRMTQAESDVFYEAEYRLLYQGQAGPNPKDLAVQRARSELSLNFIRPWVAQLAYVLDIGCSSGALLKRFQSHYQAHAAGVEPGLLYRQYAQGLSLEVYSSLGDLPSSYRNSFDLISMMHVLEHLPDPVTYLRQLREDWLQPNGWLLLEVPNLYAHDCFEVAHLVSFSARTLEQVVRKSGFRLTRLSRHGMPRSRIIPLYITMLAQSDGDRSISVTPERLVSIKRKIGRAQRRLFTRLFPRLAWLTIPL